MTLPIPSLGDSDKVLEAIESWAQNVGPNGQNPEAAHLGRVVEELLQQETSYAEQNAKRFRLVCEAFQQMDFATTVNIVDHLMAPHDKAINKMLKRTNILKAIRFEDSEFSQAELKEQSKAFFLQWANGDFGQQVLAHFMEQLKSDILAAHCEKSDSSTVHTCFELVVFAMSDTWRRFCLTAQSFPWQLFSLTELGLEAFAARIAEFQGILHRCPHCIDAGFGLPILKEVDPTDSRSLIEFLSNLELHFLS